MDFELHSFRHSEVIFSQPEFVKERDSIFQAISGTTDEEVIEIFSATHFGSKSVSKSINKILKTKLEGDGWASEPNIFQDSDYSSKKESTWRLDFARNAVSVEVAFNHGGNIAWNLLKPVLAGELNHVKKDIQTKLGIVVCATDSMKISGGFDNAVGSYEDFIKYLKPLRNFLTVPILLVGLKPFRTFRIVHSKVGRVSQGSVRRL